MLGAAPEGRGRGDGWEGGVGEAWPGVAVLGVALGAGDGMALWREEPLGGGEWAVSTELVSWDGDIEGVEEGAVGREAGASHCR